MTTLIIFVHVIAAILLTIAIAVQQKGGGLSSAISGSGNTSFHLTRRGPEKFLYFFTMVTAFVFVGSSVLSLFM